MIPKNIVYRFVKVPKLDRLDLVDKKLEFHLNLVLARCCPWLTRTAHTNCK